MPDVANEARSGTKLAKWSDKGEAGKEGGKVELELKYHTKQVEIMNHPNRFKVIAKGRRFGLTKGLANYCIEKMLESEIKVLWVDTIYSNIIRYVERYFLPELKQIPNKYYKWREQKSELKIGKSLLDLRSADRPENIEGLGYNIIIINEAGIVLKNRNLWLESIAPMILDYKAEVIIGGTPKGKQAKGQEHLFYELSKNPKWKYFNYTSYDNPLLEHEEIKELEMELPTALREQEIYGKFIDQQTRAIIKREWWIIDDKQEYLNKKIEGIYQSWDTAFKVNQENDYTVGTTWAVTKDKYYLINIYRNRVEFPELIKAVKEQAEIYHPKEIIIEDHASGQSLIQQLRNETRLPIKAVRKDRDKISYVNQVTPLFEAGKVVLSLHKNSGGVNYVTDGADENKNAEAEAAQNEPKRSGSEQRRQGVGNKAESGSGINTIHPQQNETGKNNTSENGWVNTMQAIIINECEEFPSGEFDDIVDSITQLLNYVRSSSKTNLDSKEIVTKKIEFRKKYY